MKFLWTTVYVRNLEESIDFYTSLLGLKVTRRFPAGLGVEIAFMGSGADNETLVELLADSSNSEVAYSEFLSVGFAVASVEDMLQVVKSRNIPVHSGPVETSGLIFFCIKDPNGLNVQFFQQK